MMLINHENLKDYNFSTNEEAIVESLLKSLAD